MFMPFAGNWGWGLVGMILQMLLWGAFIVGISYLIIRIVRGTGGLDQDNNPMNVLKKRYAAGEISEVDFEKMKDRIK